MSSSLLGSGDSTPIDIFIYLLTINITTMSLLDSKYTIFFDVVRKEDISATGVAKSLFYSNEHYHIGQHFTHHYHNVECVVTGVRNNARFANRKIRDYIDIAKDAIKENNIARIEECLKHIEKTCDTTFGPY